MTEVPRTRWARTIDGACIAYRDIGEGPTTLVLIRGWVSHLAICWEQPRFARFMRRLSQNMRVIEKAALLGWGGPGPELAVLCAPTSPERTVCLALCGLIHRRCEPDFPWGYSPEAFEEILSKDLRAWGGDAGARDFGRGGYGYVGGDSEAPDAPPYSDPELLRWNAKPARKAATPASYEAFSRTWFGTDVRPALRAPSAPTACFFGQDDPDAEAHARPQASLVPQTRSMAIATPTAVMGVPEPEPMVAATEGFIDSVRQEEAALDRMPATALFTDIVGSADKACEMGDPLWTDLLETHDMRVRALPARHRGADVGVHIGARVGALAGPSEVLVSSSVKGLVVGPVLDSVDRREHRLSGVSEPRHLYAAEA